MSLRKTVAMPVLCLLMASVLLAQSSKFDGVWEGKLDHEGKLDTITFDLHAKGNALTGQTLMNGDDFGPITQGKIAGNKVTFTVASVSCEGALEEDHLKLTITVQNGNRFHIDARRKPQRTR
jgi:hypothetical protein